MAYKEVIRRQYEDLNNLSSMLRNYIEIYRLLISSTSELNNTSIIKKGELKKAIERIDDVGDIIDEILKIIKRCEGTYIKYCFTQSEINSNNFQKEDILTEIHNELDMHNEKE